MTRTRTTSLTAVLATIATLLAAAAAHAGSYTVSGTCGMWGPFSNNGARVAVYDAGCLLVARNTFGNFSSGQGTEGGWIATAPPGAAIAGFTYEGFLKGTSGWDAALYDSNGRTHAVCP